MGKKGYVLLLAVVFLLIMSINALSASAAYVAKLHVSVGKSLYGPSEEIHAHGIVLLSNLSASDTGFLPVANGNASINFTLENSSGIQVQHWLNTTGDGSFKTRSDNFPAGIQLMTPAAEGFYNFTATYSDPNGDAWNAGGVIRVFGTSVDYISISPQSARYYAGDIVQISLRALRYVGDRKVALAGVSINSSMRYINRTQISNFSCITNSGGVCTVQVTAPSRTGTYLLEANEFLSTSSFVVVPFEAFAYIKDSTGESFKEVFKANEVATVEAKLIFNATTPTGDFVFNGTITGSNNVVIANITSTDLNSNNSYTNRFSFTISNAFSNGVYYASITAYKTGTSDRASATTSFQVRSWALSINKAAKDSGFEYEYTAFANKNVSLEIFPKESQNGTVITGLNGTQFNITLGGKTGDVVAIGNASWNASCSSAGCYAFGLNMPPAAGQYLLSVALNYSSEVQTVHRLVSVSALSLSATPTSHDGQLKEVFSTTEFVYISLAAKNQTASVNISDVVLESVAYENGTRFTFSDVPLWSDVNSSNSTFEWAWNGSAQRLKLDAPKVGGDYLLTVFINNRSAAASTKFGINPYSVCGSAKSTAGTVDSSSSFYVWQYKTSDTVYFELKVSQAQNDLGRAKAENSTFSSSYYGMGGACQLDTTKSQAITNATVTVLSAVNLLNGATASINTTASVCSADDNSGTYTCTVKPLTRWDGGRYAVKMQVTGPDGETKDKAESIFEARAFYMWAYLDSWTNKPVSNLTFNVQMYEAGNNWWSNYGSTGGITGEIALQKVEYNGKDGEWLWPPIDIGYNTTGLNSSNVTNGRGTFSLVTSRIPKGTWEPGYYFATIKGTSTATGEIDYGTAWFGIKQWDAYSTPVEASGSTYGYKNSFSAKENVSLYIRIANAGDWSDSGGASLAGGANIAVGVKKLQYYTTWPPTELNTSAYNIGKINVSTSSPWYYSASPGTHSKYVMNISPASGRWDSGYYNLILDINGTETGYGWFNVITFNVNVQPTNSTGSYTYTSKGNGPVYFNVTTTKNQKASYGYYGSGDYINTTVRDVVLRTWLETTWQPVEYNYPEDLNISTLQVNGSALLQVNTSGSWPAGYYGGEITLADSENSTSTGYLYFSIRSFRVETSTVNYNVDNTGNVSVNLNLRQPDWSNSNLAFGNYTVTDVYEESWNMGSRARASYGSYTPSNSSSFNATTMLNISPSTSWSSANNGYHYLTIVVRDNADNATQNGWVSFRSVPFVVTLGSVANQYGTSQANNVTVQATLRTAVSNALTTANLTRVFENTYPSVTTYGFAVDNCTSTSSANCWVNQTKNITLIAPSGGWGSGYHYLYLEFVSTDGSSKVTSDNTVWFNAIQAYDGYFSNYDEGGFWKYNYGFGENLTIRLYVRNANYAPQNANITNVEVSEDGDTCWVESCRNYTSYAYNVLNGSGGNEVRGNGTIRIITPGRDWKRGPHSIKATVSGPAGTAVIKGGYIYVRDTAVPTVTINSPTNRQAINQTSFIFNLSGNEPIRCSSNYIYNYDSFAQSYCMPGDNATVPACNSTGLNGSTAYFNYIPINTEALNHVLTIDATSWQNQDYAIVAFCYDVDWNQATAKVAFTYNVTPVSVPVRVNLTSPANSSTINTTTVSLAFNVSGGSGKVANCSLYLNVSNAWGINVTQNRSITNVTNTTTVTVANVNNGTYVWNTYCHQQGNASNFAWAPANFTFTVASNISQNLSSVNVTLYTPVTGAIANTSTINYTFNISGSGSSNCTLHTNTTGTWLANQTGNYLLNGTRNFTNVNIQPGSYAWNVNCINATDAAFSDWGDSNFTFSVINNVTQTSVAVNLSSPANLSLMNSSPVTLVYNASGLAGMNCSVWSNSTGVWKANFTNSSAGPIQHSIAHGFVSGSYVWNANCVDSSNSSNYGWAALNWTIAVTNISSSASGIAVNLSSPANDSTLPEAASFIYNASGASTLNCTLWGNFTGSWEANLTNNSASNGVIRGGSLNVSGGKYLWNAKCMNAGDSTAFAWALYNWTFTRS